MFTAPDFSLTAELILMAISFVIGYYIGERGVKGVSSDLSDVKADIAGIKAKLSPTPVVVSAPAV